MTKAQYTKARRTVRDNGMFALRWLRMSEASVLLQLANQKPDPLAQKVEDKRIMAYADA